MLSLKYFKFALFVQYVSSMTMFGNAAEFESPFLLVEYPTNQELVLNMSSVKEITVKLQFNRDLLVAKRADTMNVIFQTTTLSPQFNILTLDPTSARVSITRRQLVASGFYVEVKLKLHANYIGHAILKPKAIEYVDETTKKFTTTSIPEDLFRLRVTILQHEGIWATLFIISVSIFMLISYINLGAQLDKDNMEQVVKRPFTLIFGFIISVIVMPFISWFVGQWLFKDQLLYRIGSYVYACCPAASASTLWAVMLNSDKELSVGLQVITTVGAIVTMPSLLWLMDKLVLTNAPIHAVNVPYARLIQALCALMIALAIGWSLGRYERAQKISRKIFRPLVLFVLVFIILYSSILYWHIYMMFDWNITIASFIITFFTCIISGMLGHFSSCDLDRAITIAISSTYKNTGIAFAVLLVGFKSPDTYIAYVPCLTQIVITSLSLYLAYTVLSLIKCFKRRGQPDVIQASAGDTEASIGREEIRNREKKSSFGEKSTKSEENDEFIALDVAEIDIAGLPVDSKTVEDERQTTVKQKS